MQTQTTALTGREQYRIASTKHDLVIVPIRPAGVLLAVRAKSGNTITAVEFTGPQLALLAEALTEISDGATYSVVDPS